MSEYLPFAGMLIMVLIIGGYFGGRALVAGIIHGFCQWLRDRETEDE